MLKNKTKHHILHNSTSPQHNEQDPNPHNTTQPRPIKHPQTPIKQAFPKKLQKQHSTSTTNGGTKKTITSEEHGSAAEKCGRSRRSVESREGHAAATAKAEAAGGGKFAGARRFPAAARRGRRRCPRR